MSQVSDTRSAYLKPHSSAPKPVVANFTRSTDFAFRLAMYSSESPRIIWPRFVLWNTDMSTRTLADTLCFSIRNEARTVFAVVPHPTRGDARRPLPSWGEANKEPGFFPFVRSGLRLVEANHFRRALNDTRTSGREDEDGAESWVARGSHTHPRLLAASAATKRERRIIGGAERDILSRPNKFRPTYELWVPPRTLTACRGAAGRLSRDITGEVRFGIIAASFRRRNPSLRYIPTVGIFWIESAPCLLALRGRRLS